MRASSTCSAGVLSRALKTIFHRNRSCSCIGHLEKFSPFGVDVATGVESEPRRKESELLKIFIETAKSFKAKTD